MIQELFAVGLSLFLECVVLRQSAQVLSRTLERIGQKLLSGLRGSIVGAQLQHDSSKLSLDCTA